MTNAVTAADAATTHAPIAGESRLRVILRNAFPFLVVGACWEIAAHAGIFPPRLFPPLEAIAAAFWRLTLAGILPHHVAETLVRLFAGFALAAAAGVTIGIAMGRSRRAEDYLLPLVSIVAPVPGIAYAPLFMLWFGIGSLSVILLVGVVSAFPIIFNTWTGVKAVKEIWLRSAQVMGADRRRLFRHVIMPGALPYILTGLRLGLAQAWRILVVVEVLASLSWGLGVLIFGAREFLNTDVMLAGVAVIGMIGLTLEKLVFAPLERKTVVRWGDGGTVTSERTRTLLRGTLAILVVAACYEAAARSGHFPRALVPTLPRIAETLFTSIADGSMIHHAGATLYRMLCGFGLAVAVGVPLGVVMGRFRPVEHFIMPLASALMPIPSLAWVPVFILWFGLGNTVSILIVFYAALFPMLLNAWSGVRAVNPLWLRAAGAMGAREGALFCKVILPGASPFIITGLRQAFLRAWIAVVGAEMLASSDFGLGWVIYDAKEFLNTDLMLATILVIGAIGFLCERFVFRTLERVTVQRWGMVHAAKA